MSKQSIKKLRFIIFIFLGVFVVISVLMPNESFARQQERRESSSPDITRQRDKGVTLSPRDMPRRGKRKSDSSDITRQRGKEPILSPRGKHQGWKRRVITPHVSRRGHVVRKLPKGYRRSWHKKDAYFYYSGVFYRRAPSGFIVIEAPIGAFVISIPVGYRRLWIEDAWYYVYGGVFYQRGPYGYVVVEVPFAVDVEYNTPLLVEPPETATGEVAVTADILNVRLGPTLRHPVIYQIHEGYILEVHGKAKDWLFVQLPNGEFGWVMTVFTTRLRPLGSG